MGFHQRRSARSPLGRNTGGTGPPRLGAPREFTTWDSISDRSARFPLGRNTGGTRPPRLGAPREFTTWGSLRRRTTNGVTTGGGGSAALPEPLATPDLNPPEQIFRKTQPPMHVHPSPCGPSRERRLVMSPQGLRSLTGTGSAIDPARRQEGKERRRKSEAEKERERRSQNGRESEASAVPLSPLEPRL